mmetsp:Transcript_30042/g.50516  ORF Transcript_30042/g.50516 Transcript_30042/m.50516 type:complete len:282 (-) Transcript_30042:216-1061(-)|eukprot:CAMPEP_0198211686 /NCGR_PEP_ID=MMETSP1445-20131203/25134_1 /TAXON_ID=36898 /ORGANISM="Pyramimonas sp., Strain CCMP2087" /LENGTH=281 /DNA_ID=CAMNT_0043886007 /DNA_START=147 /DNA_END=992 /DNA_ORIENTATION=+
MASINAFIKPKSKLSAFDLAAIGGSAGVVEVTIQQPSVCWKNFLQRGMPIPMNPVLWYRGWAVNAASIFPICFIQFGANRALEGMLDNYDVKQTHFTRMGCAAGAGVSSAAVGCTAELMMLHQQKTGGSLVEVAKTIIQRDGAHTLLRGWLPTAYRESLWAATYLAVTPILQEKLRGVDALEPYPNATWALGAVSAGLFGAVATHPFDTVKTRMQANLEGDFHKKFIRTAREVISQRQLYAGFLPRGGRVVGATFILSSVKERLATATENKRAGLPYLPWE